ncbi:MAG: FKBP-type peptidyl-prolyl cis-trans isomerase [Candidatus Sericytochromatia bacterium]|nr:FKBP-type peptidyl-prolyl cis-trans isomerase [Candidatus Sericytochromatia bacterium]
MALALVGLGGCNQGTQATLTPISGAAGSQSSDVTTLPANAQTTPSGLKYGDFVVGTGASPRTGQVCTVHYSGWLTNGKKFDSSVDSGRPFSFPLGQGRVIKGWDEGVASMHVGGKRKLVIPAPLGYGAGGSPPDIPPNATLVFEVELLGIR